MTRDETIAALACPVQVVTLAGKEFRVKGFDGHSRAEWFTHVTANTDEAGKITNREGFKAKLIQLSLVDDAGKLLFTPEELPLITTFAAVVIDELFTASLKLNKLTKEDADDAGATFQK